MRIKRFQGEKNMQSKPPRDKDRPSFIPSSRGRFKWDHTALQGPPYQGKSRAAILESKTSFQPSHWCLAPSLAVAALAGQSAAQCSPCFEALLWPTDLRKHTQALQDVEITSDHSCSFPQRRGILYTLFGNYTKV